jgi:hypothetical protein
MCVVCARHVNLRVCVCVCVCVCVRVFFIDTRRDEGNKAGDVNLILLPGAWCPGNRS